jgi:hypothetical protein
LKSGVVPDTLVKKRVERLTALLMLTPDQQTQAFTILKRDMQKRLDARAKDRASASDSIHSCRMHRNAMGNGPHGRFGLPAEFLTVLTDGQKQFTERRIDGAIQALFLRPDEADSGILRPSR